MSLLHSLIRNLVGGWSLERKSLLFVGLALLVPVCLAFFVLQIVAERLVKDTTRQAANDYARNIVAWRHVTSKRVQGTQTVEAHPEILFEPAILEQLQRYLVVNLDYRHEFLMLNEAVNHEDLEYSLPPPMDSSEYAIIQELEGEFRQRLKAENDAASTSAQQPDASTTNPAFNSITLDANKDLFREDGPVFMPDKPEEGWYVYYHAVNFQEVCLYCHSPRSDPKIPFRVVKVMMPYDQTQVASVTTLAVMITVTMVTVALSLLIVHWVLRRLILNPLSHLRDVSDEISQGRTDLRASIDTGDEFNELADAFNRMLRHLTDAQAKLQTLNTELDVKVDQLAQANLSLYEANRLKSDFLANMSHELRTPLNSILGFSDVLRDVSSLTEKQKKYATNIQESGRLLLDMINDILDLAKVEAGKMDVSASSFELNRIVQAQCDMLRSLIDEKNMDLQVNSEAETITIFQDQAKLQQIVTNLLSNAIKFTPDGGLITVTIGNRNDEFFHVTVADTGVGIPESDFEVIFEKFRQSNVYLKDGGLTRPYSGTGLGLSIVKELCKLLGGEVQLTSQLGTGSIFHVILPSHYHANYKQELAAG